MPNFFRPLQIIPSALGLSKSKEKKLVPMNDGRRRRATGRSEKFHYKVKPEFKQKITEEAHRKGIGVAALLEIVWAHYEDGRHELPFQRRKERSVRARGDM